MEKLIVLGGTVGERFLLTFDNRCRTRIPNGQRIQATLCAEKTFPRSPMVDPARPSTFMPPKKAKEEDLPLLAQRFRANSIPALLCFCASRSLGGASLEHLTTCRRRTRRVRWPVPRGRRSRARTRSDEAANRQSAGPLALARNERGHSEQASASCRLGKGATRQEAPRVVSVRKRRTRLAHQPVCSGGEPPCYQHLLEGV
jgi:hypothetical protein